MHPLRKLRESGKYTVAQMRELLAENGIFNSPAPDSADRGP